MTMALAVAMVACTGATSVKGETGATGPQGEAGPAGPPGDPGNEQPVVTKPLPMVYLAMAGTGEKKTSDGLDLSKHFDDAEKASLNYEFATSDKGVATAELSAGKMIVKAKGVGSATITVMAYDGFTDATSATFDVMVVPHNAKPTVDLQPADAASGFPAPAAGNAPAKLGEALYLTSGGGSVTEIVATIHAGEAGTVEDAVIFEYAMGAAGAGDDIVAVEITQKAGVTDTWKISLTPLKEGKQNVYVIVKDKFGIPAETPEDAAPVSGTTDDTVDAQDFQFVAFVNTVPKLEKPLPDKTYVVSATAVPAYITISEFFDTGEVLPTKGPKIGSMEKDALAPLNASGDTAPDAAGALPAAPLLAANDPVATVCTITTSDPGVVDVDDTLGGTGTTFTVAADPVPVFAAAPGTADVTITCRDDESFATDTATITVRAAR